MATINAILTGVFTAALVAGTADAGSAPTAPAPQRDREAIRALAGAYRVTFDFIETLPLLLGYELAAPQHSEGTEWVLLLEDGPRAVELQHLLMVGKNRQVVKHWRQRWVYEPSELLEFRGEHSFERRRVAPEEARGAWSQSVFEVDDAPRYQGLGRWSHTDGLSSWESNATWRPLPRREYTKRSDYQILGCRNRHTLTPLGWTHEQDNTKLRRVAGGLEALAREVGLNNYRRATDIDISTAQAYWHATEHYWRQVREAWQRALEPPLVVVDDKSPDGEPRYTRLLALAERLAAGADDDPQVTRRAIERVLAQHVRTPPGSGRGGARAGTLAAHVARQSRPVP
jgi:hypothetical protein